MGTLYLQAAAREQAQRILNSLQGEATLVDSPDTLPPAGNADLVLYLPEAEPEDPARVVEHLRHLATQTNVILILPAGHNGWVRLLPPGVVRDALPEDALSPKLLRDALELHTARLQTGQLGQQRLSAQHLMHLQRDLALRLGRANSLEEALEEVLNTALLIPGIDSGVAYHVREQRRLEPMVYKGVGHTFVEQMPVAAAHFHDLEALLSRREPTYQDSRITQTNPLFFREGIKAQALLPVSLQGVPFVVLALASHILVSIPESLYTMLEAIGGQLAGILQRIRLMEEQQTSVRLLNELLSVSPEGVAIAGPDGRVVLWNASYARVSGIAPPEAQGQFLWDVLVRLFPRRIRSEERRRRLREWVDVLLSQGGALANGGARVVPLERPDGQETVVEVRAFTVDTARGRYLVSLVQEVAEREAQRRNLERHLEELQAITEVNTAILQTLELEPLLENVLAAACRVIPGAEKGSVILRRPETETLELVALHRYEDPRVRQAGQDIRRGYAARAIAEAHPLLIEDVQADPTLEYTGEVPEMLVRSAITAPLIADEQVLGAISLDNLSRPGAFDAHDLRLLSAFAGQAALAIRHARLYERARRQLERLSFVQHISSRLRVARDVGQMLPLLLDETLAILRTDAGAVLMYDPRRQVLEVEVGRGWFKRFYGSQMDASEGISGQVFTTKRGLALEDIHTAPQISPTFKPQVPQGWAGACLPIQNESRSLGVLWVAVPAPRSISTEQFALLTTICELAGNAMQRMRLHTEMRKQLQRLTMLRTIDSTINASMDLRLTFHVMLEQLVGQPRVGAAAVALFDPNAQTLEYTAWYGLTGYRRRNTYLWLHSSPAYKAIVERKAITIEGEFPLPVQFTAQGYTPPAYPMYTAVPLVAKGRVKGVLEVFYQSAFVPEAEWEVFLETLATQAAIAVDNATMLNHLQSANQELRVAYERTLHGWVQALELRDMETREHSRRVTEMTVRLALELGVDARQIEHIRRGALLHDIGKLGVPDSILHKVGPLTEEEWVEMRKHPLYAYEWLADIPYLQPALDIPYCHHEKWDGSGYPRGLKGEEIPLAARIFSVVDVWDALRSDRPYRAAWPPEKVRAYLREQSGKHFDPHVAEAFLCLLKSWEAQGEKLRAEDALPPP